MTIKEAQSVADIENVLKNNDKVVVFFYAPWCSKSRRFRQLALEMASVHIDLTFIKVNIDEVEEPMAKYMVSDAGTFCFFKDGKEVDRMSTPIHPQLISKSAALSRL